MARLKGCCCCGLRGGAKSVGVFFLVISLLMLIGVIVAWAVCYSVPTESQGFGVDTSEGTFGLNVGESRSVIGGRSEKVELNLGKLGRYGASVSDRGHVSLHTPGGELRSDNNHLVPGLDGLAKGVQIALICCTVYVLLAVIFNSLLIHGVEYDSSCAVLAWLVFYGIHFVLHSIAVVGALIACLVMVGSVNVNGVILPGIIGGVVDIGVCVLLWFWWVLVLTFYRELRDATRGFKYQREVSLQDSPTPLVCTPNGQLIKAEECA
ncbi:uncharacterized protein LOC122388047 [Amphibalanus amphitrite]|uniref:uncharacterized protein LOC122388047 n=1 Tax=Amphibalanus amphitrite TaxID=1232801 RepID=UPI001C922828|nr:uncharacterized protein LOC122388047 [Amphibalanus amphitrite]XP_043234749.1 uncharacterized protein LOC122388047 [Amphibalanus amphitrite]